MTNEHDPLAPFETRDMKFKVEELHYYFNEIAYPVAEESPDLPVETEYESEDAHDIAMQQFIEKYEARAMLAYLLHFFNTDTLTDLPGRIQGLINAAKV